MIRAESIEAGALLRPSTEQGLPALVDRAAQALASARTAAEVLEAKELAGFAYDAAKRVGRIAKAKDAHDTLIAAAHRAQADALLIESQAKRRLADEYDAAQERGEVRSNGETSYSNPEKLPASVIGARQAHEARQIRDAEEHDPGIVARTLNAAIERGDEPTRAEVKRALTYREKLVIEAAEDEKKLNDKRALAALRKAWSAASPTARQMFLDYIKA